MSKPKLLDAYTKDSDVIASINPDYAVVAKWGDDNAGNENRVGYFVSKDATTSGLTIAKATSDSKVFGITVVSPGFASNVTDSMKDTYKELLPKYAYVCFTGISTVIDNGECVVNGRCQPNDSGIAIPNTDGDGYIVIERVDATHIRILVEHRIDFNVVGTTLNITF